MFLSCSNYNDEKTEVQQQAISPVLKTAKMVSFEKALKDFYESKATNESGVLNKRTAQTKLEVQNEAITLLQELGTNQNVIEEKKSMSTDGLVYFALEEYSKKLSQMYNQNKKVR